ncbi:MAG TPA: head-tail connector protein [Accumulibacter sp.]|uniref:head-tail connector protein n=1 Tax=Accumulibacter sp. TaxID=2053492 RepID=UPI002BE47931|nr:head-tail connector protein [Accumulibacter sp.]HRD89307.1 head-tail connector protein [Accumulibacter sp.]HRD90688.1 head-tail connector protein [Accumulibacter sp.]
MPLQLVTPPAAEPVSLAEAKLHLRVDFPDEDALIASLIAAARQAAETITGRQLVTARWKLVLDSFPGPSLMGVPAGLSFSLPGHAILLPKSPVQSVFAIEYLDMAGAMQTMPPAEYTVDAACEPARVTPVFGRIWPIALPQIGAVAVTFDAGYGTAASVPEGIKSWIKLRVGSLYAHREEVALLTRGKIEPLPFIDGLLDPYKVVTI